jgi:chromosome segregation ATPase
MACENERNAYEAARQARIAKEQELGSLMSQNVTLVAELVQRQSTMEQTRLDLTQAMLDVVQLTWQIDQLSPQIQTKWDEVQQLSASEEAAYTTFVHCVYGPF